MDKLDARTMALYLGCDVKTPKGIEKLVSVGLLGPEEQKYHTLLHFMSYTNAWHESNKLILRELSSMSEEEKLELYKLIYPNSIEDEEWVKIQDMDDFINNDNELLNFTEIINGINYLRLKFFDCDRLIEKGLAIKQ